MRDRDPNSYLVKKYSRTVENPELVRQQINQIWQNRKQVPLIERKDKQPLHPIPTEQVKPPRPEPVKPPSLPDRSIPLEDTEYDIRKIRLPGLPAQEDQKQIEEQWDEEGWSDEWSYEEAEHTPKSAETKQSHSEQQHRIDLSNRDSFEERRKRIQEAKRYII